MNGFEIFRTLLALIMSACLLFATIIFLKMPHSYTYQVTPQDEINLLDGSMVTGKIAFRIHPSNGLQDEAQAAELQTQFKKSLQYFLSGMTRLEAVSFFNPENIGYQPEAFFEKINMKHLPYGVDILLELYVEGEVLCPLQMFYLPKEF